MVLVWDCLPCFRCHFGQHSGLIRFSKCQSSCSTYYQRSYKCILPFAVCKETPLHPAMLTISWTDIGFAAHFKIFFRVYRSQYFWVRGLKNWWLILLECKLMIDPSRSAGSLKHLLQSQMNIFLSFPSRNLREIFWFLVVFLIIFIFFKFKTNSLFFSSERGRYFAFSWIHDIFFHLGKVPMGFRKKSKFSSKIQNNSKICVNYLINQ
jgi:hypothetical protein